MGNMRVRVTFPETLIKEPLIYNLGHKFDVVTNIRGAQVDEEIGWVVLELDGQENEIQKGLGWMRSMGVRVDPLGGDVVEG